LNSEAYNRSFTVVKYAPAGQSEIVSLELVELSSSVTLSQQYAFLGKVAKEIGKVYEKSGDENLAQLAEGYYIMEEKAKGLSKLVGKQLQDYDKKILNTAAILTDDYWECVGGCYLAWCLSNWELCEPCYALFCLSCFIAPNPVSCGACAACIGLPVAFCAVCCLFFPVC
jgi:hypothetical protein